MRETPHRRKPLIGNAFVVGHLMELCARMEAAGDEESAHIGDCIKVVLGASKGGRI